MFPSMKMAATLADARVRPQKTPLAGGNMKKIFVMFLNAVLVLGIFVASAVAQGSGSVKGVCKDLDGKPIVDGVVVYANQEAFHQNGIPVQMDENTLDFDLKKEQENQAKGVGISAEQLKQQQELAAKQQKEVNTVKALNDKLNAAKTAADAGDYDTAIAAMNDANQVDPSRDLVWFKLGDYERLSAPKQTDPAEKQKRYEAAVADYQKALELKQATPDKDPAAQAKALAAYYNNLAEAYYKAKKIDDAVKNYEMAAQVDPTSLAQSYFNIGAVLTNSGRADEANAAFDKVIAADPTRAEAYYQKGLNQLGKATLQGDKTVAPPGTAEAFQKYLELSPTGPNADSAKALLASLGATVETSFGKKKTPKK